MSQSPKLLAFAGSTRQDSFNKKLVKVAAEGAREAGADATIIDLKDYPLPLFDQDLEAEGLPDNVLLLKQLFKAHQGLIIASPEYNSSVTPLLKNTLDWVSRPAPNESTLAAFQGKVASLVSASPGALGGLRGLVQLRSILGNIGATDWEHSCQTVPPSNDPQPVRILSASEGSRHRQGIALSVVSEVRQRRSICQVSVATGCRLRRVRTPSRRRRLNVNSNQSTSGPESTALFPVLKGP